MIAALKEVYSIIAHFIDESMFQGDSARPDIRPKVFKRFGFALAGEWGFPDIFD